MPLYPRELKLLDHCVRRYYNVLTTKQLAKRTVSSIGTVQKAKFLINCRPREWSSVMNGQLTIGAAYQKYTDRQTTSFEG